MKLFLFSICQKNMSNIYKLKGSELVFQTFNMLNNFETV